MYDQCTLYDCVNRYGYTIAGILGNYPIWDESKREWLNDEIYRYFEYRELASETPKLFSSYAQRTMNRVMPKVNSIAAFALSGSENWSDTLTDTVTSTSRNDSENTGANTSTTTYGHTQTETPGLTTQTDTTTESKATALMSETPQVQLASTENYMTNLNESGSSGTSGTTTTQSGTDVTAMTGQDVVSGTNSGTSASVTTGDTTHTAQSGQLSELASNWANTMPDLLGLIFDALEVCFMQVI